MEPISGGPQIGNPILLRHGSFAHKIEHCDLLTSIIEWYSLGQRDTLHLPVGLASSSDCISRILKICWGSLRPIKGLHQTPATEPCLGGGPLYEVTKETPQEKCVMTNKAAQFSAARAEALRIEREASTRKIKREYRFYLLSRVSLITSLHLQELYSSRVLVHELISTIKWF